MRAPYLDPSRGLTATHLIVSAWHLFVSTAMPWPSRGYKFTVTVIVVALALIVVTSAVPLPLPTVIATVPQLLLPLPLSLPLPLQHFIDCCLPMQILVVCHRHSHWCHRCHRWSFYDHCCHPCPSLPSPPPQSIFPLLSPSIWRCSGSEQKPILLSHVSGNKCISRCSVHTLTPDRPKKRVQLAVGMAVRALQDEPQQASLTMVSGCAWRPGKY